MNILNTVNQPIKEISTFKRDSVYFVSFRSHLIFLTPQKILEILLNLQQQSKTSIDSQVVKFVIIIENLNKNELVDGKIIRTKKTSNSQEKFV